MAPRISLAMIVKNEEQALPACLEAARPWVDEIVVVDTGSTDHTREIAESFGARVVPWQWCDDFAAARNESLRHVTGDWVLALDADEVLTPESGPALRDACATTENIVAYDVKIVCPRQGDGGLVRLNWFPRLFRNLPGVRWEGVIHEQVVTSLAGRGRTERSRVEVLHSGYELTPAEMQAKARRNVGLLERQLHEEPDYAPGWFQLAETYVLLGRLDEGIDAYRKCLRLVQLSRLTLSGGVVAVALQNLGAALIQRGDKDEGMRTIEAALEVDPELAPAHVQLGNHAMAEQRWEEAERRFATALGIVERQTQHSEYQISPWLIHFLRGCALARQGKLEPAMASFERALAVNPRHADSLWLMALAAADARDFARCLAALDRVGALGRDDFEFHVQRAVALGALGRFAEAIAPARAALAYRPDTVPIIGLLAEALVRVGRLAEAAQAYERRAALTPGETAPLLALAQCREAIGDRDGMMDAYRRAVELAPDSADVLFALGSACLRGGALDAAEDCLAAAVAHAPERHEFRLNHALCLLKKGDVATARTALAAIIARWPEMTHAAEIRRLLAALKATAGASALAGGAGGPAS